MDILHHFHHPTLYPLNFWGIDLSINQNIITLWLATLLVIILCSLASRRPKIIPGFLQNIIEATIDFIKNEMLFNMPESQKSRWIGFLAALFLLVFSCNLIGLIPGFTAVTASLSFTATLALVVFFTCQAASLLKRGPTGYFKAWLPDGIPPFVIPFLLPIEILTRMAQPFSLALRLFANLFAGHAIIIVFLTLATMVKSYFIGILPLAGSVIISAFEIFIGFIQAFIFTYLSAMYLTEAVGEH